MQEVLYPQRHHDVGKDSFPGNYLTFNQSSQLPRASANTPEQSGTIVLHTCYLGGQ
jgi:hypothetical protein